MVVLDCGAPGAPHTFHTSCLQQCESCPLCRAQITSTSIYDSWPSDSLRNPPFSQPCVALISLFGGLGTDVLALRQWMSRFSSLSMIGPVGYVDSNRELATAVVHYWRTLAPASDASAVTFLGEVIWHLIDPFCHTLAVFFGRYPPGTPAPALWRLALPAIVPSWG